LRARPGGRRTGPRRRALLLWLVLAGCAAVRPAAAADALDPAVGSIAGAVYANPYFGLRYPLPAGWSAGPGPPAPSYSGYYILATPAPPPAAKATILVAAQDRFFAAPPVEGADALLKNLSESAAKSGAAKPRLSTVTIAGRGFTRLMLEASPLSRIVLATDIRCHVLIFTFAAADRQQLERLAESLDRLTLAAEGAVPACVKGYATAQTIRHKTPMPPAAPYFVKIPVRILVGTDGGVSAVHVIRASAAQRSNIAAALKEWRFAPYLHDGRPTAVETGLSFEFAPAGR
jgi:hypothetical protein